ncbi:MAG: ABC transporter permease [Actinobacteria bacterium]|nr:MAG: ABC transporter permease [Actinomycetota bacterium]
MAIAVPTRPARRRLVERLRAPLSILREVARRPVGLFGLVVVGGLLALAVAAPNIADRLQGPSLAHPLGTDELGRDLLSRLIFGTRIALGVAIPAVSAALAAGLVLGAVAGYVGRWVDNVLIVVMDTLQAFPAVILALALLAVLGPSLRNVIIVIAVSFAPAYARVARALVLTTKQNQFIEAERSLGASDLRIVGIHILPNIVGSLFILLAMDIPSAITVEAGLSFLGLGVQPPTPSWGVILNDGFDRVRETPWPVLWAGLMLMLATLGFTMLGETLRDVVDPKLARIRRFRRT